MRLSLQAYAMARQLQVPSVPSVASLYLSVWITCAYCMHVADIGRVFLVLFTMLHDVATARFCGSRLVVTSLCLLASINVVLVMLRTFEEACERLIVWRASNSGAIRRRTHDASGHHA